MVRSGDSLTRQALRAWAHESAHGTAAGAAQDIVSAVQGVMLAFGVAPDDIASQPVSGADRFNDPAYAGMLIVQVDDLEVAAAPTGVVGPRGHELYDLRVVAPCGRCGSDTPRDPPFTCLASAGRALGEGRGYRHRCPSTAAGVGHASAAAPTAPANATAGIING